MLRHRGSYEIGRDDVAEVKFSRCEAVVIDLGGKGKQRTFGGVGRSLRRTGIHSEGFEPRRVAPGVGVGHVFRYQDRGECPRFVVLAINSEPREVRGGERTGRNRNPRPNRIQCGAADGNSPGVWVRLGS